MIAIIVAIALTAMTPLGGVQTPTSPPVWGGGGPDEYGYRWLDSDTTCPGAPTYNWVEIKGVGTQVTGLGDDNVVGPFALGFDFPYYWYLVSQIYVGSNGYIAFHDNALDASPFQHMPNPERPNNLLAPIMSDIDMSAGGTIWYWTNSASDTFIVEYDSCPFWNTGGNNTFEIIISRPDSAITFQYKEQSGQPYNGWAPDNNQTGIENVGGNIGLSYLSGTIPPGNMYHPELAILFFPPESSSMEVHDAGIRNAMNDRNGGIFVLNGQPVTLWGVAKNFGNQVESEFKSFVKVKRTSGSVLFYDSIATTVTNPGDIDSLVFTNTWTPSSNGTFIIEIYTVLPGDVFPPNDTAKVEVHVLTLPATLTYDKGTPDAYYSWNGPGGYGNRFVPPIYPCNITGIRMNSQSATGVQCAFGLFDDNGQGGSPGDTLYITTVSVSTPQWYTVNLPSPVTISEGAFFVGAMSAVSSDPSFGMDSIPPISGQSWEYTGVWAPSRDLWVRDACMNAMVVATGINEWIGPVPVPAPLGIDVRPNPFGNSARIKLVNPCGNEKAIEIYDATGSLVRNLELVHGKAMFDRTNKAGQVLADGIYFARLPGSSSPVAKLIITH